MIFSSLVPSLRSCLLGSFRSGLVLWGVVGSRGVVILTCLLLSDFRLAFFAVALKNTTPKNLSVSL
jgi:hypothetical protein